MSEPPKLLLVDDEPGLRIAVQAYLEDDDEFSVQVAASADEAWALMEKSPPDLVISDIMMPQVSGYQFLDRLRADPRFQALPVIFLTARGMTADRIVGYEAGCDAYLPKPFEPEELVAIVRNLLARRNAAAATDSDNIKLEQIERGIKEILVTLGGASGLPQTVAKSEIELTPREQSVLDLVAKGLMNKEIARQLNTSVRNVEKYVSRLFGKTGTYSRTELVRFALERGLTH
ncbi:response regulator transcription factor [Oscillatoria sp. FACHB-1406]|uniref:response regulator transcription factor n=1 Tax=Oscillatoria sp. FACHB-1406 TaxID=2692846 RepID=UPI0016897287|nr:response regulator transcription factor [Oscillatoria sp. FACHB-1406]MBD2578758.1 response regulator transcription factor [Oscillatoria sp. FACHB-1406]